jgi:hypothetical protein
MGAPAPPHQVAHRAPLRSRLLTRGVQQVAVARELFAQAMQQSAAPAGGECTDFFAWAPANVLELILLHLDALERLRAGMVCVSLWRATASPQLWRHVTVHATWTHAELVAVVRVATPHVRELRVEGCRDPHVCRAFACVVARLTRDASAGGTPSNLRLLEAPAPVPEYHPTMRGGRHARAVVDTTAHLERLRASQPGVCIVMGGAAPIYCLGSIDWYFGAGGANLRLSALSDIIVTPGYARAADAPCVATEALPLVASALVRTVFLTVRHWGWGEPLNVAAHLVAAGVRDLRLRISHRSGVPGGGGLRGGTPYPPPQVPPTAGSEGPQAPSLERLDFKFDGRMREHVNAAAVWASWMAIPSLRHIRLEGLDDDVGSCDEHVTYAIAALCDAGTRLDVLDIRNTLILSKQNSPLLELVASNNAPVEVRLDDYIAFIEDAPSAVRFACALGSRVRRVVLNVLDAGFSLDDRYFLRAVPRIELSLYGAVAAELTRKNVSLRFQ